MLIKTDRKGIIKPDKEKILKTKRENERMKIIQNKNRNSG
jgi:hypothetical protein